MAIYDYSPTKVELQSHIQFFSGGRCNVTLGGGRSIQLSYRDLYAALGNMYSIPDFLPNCKQMPFSPGRFLTFLLALYLKKHYYNTYSISWT